MKLLKPELLMSALVLAFGLYCFGPGANMDTQSTAAIGGGQAPVFVPPAWGPCSVDSSNITAHPCGGSQVCTTLSVNTWSSSWFGSEDGVTAPTLGCTGITPPGGACTGAAGEVLSPSCATNW